MVVADTFWVAKRNELILSRMEGSFRSLDHFAQSRSKAKKPAAGLHWDVVVSAVEDREGLGTWIDVD